MMRDAEAAAASAAGLRFGGTVRHAADLRAWRPYRKRGGVCIVGAANGRGRVMNRSYETIRVEDRGDGLMLLTLDRPQVANAMNTQMGHDLLAFFDAVNADPLAYRVIVMTGAGDKAFCAGGDLKERQGMSDETWAAQHLLFERMIRAFLGCPVPVLGAINGAAYAGGCELALCCDFLYAAEGARFALTEVTLGIMPGAGGTQNLPRAVGERRAKEIILTGRPFSAQEAFDWGLVNRLCPPGQLLDETLETARRIADNAPISVRQAKHAIHYGLQMDLGSAMMFEIEAYNRMVPTEDRREGINAFNEKRKPRYKGR
jgi:enoyl-CoA hydratase